MGSGQLKLNTKKCGAVFESPITTIPLLLVRCWCESGDLIFFFNLSYIFKNLTLLALSISLKRSKHLIIYLNLLLKRVQGRFLILVISRYMFYYFVFLPSAYGNYMYPINLFYYKNSLSITCFRAGLKPILVKQDLGLGGIEVLPTQR